MTNFSWDLIRSMNIVHYKLEAASLIHGNKACNALAKVQYYIVDDEDPRLRREEFYCSAVGCNTVLESSAEQEAHQKARHTHYCATCSMTLPSHHLLDRHLLEVHDSFFQILAEKQAMYACLLESCKELFKSPADRKVHCMKKHNFPSDFRFDLQWRRLPTKKLGKKTVAQRAKVEEISSDSVPIPDNVDKCCQLSSRPSHTPDTDEMEYTDDFQNRDHINNNTMVPSISKSKTKIPLTFSFGVGVPRGFKRGQIVKNRHWHQKESATTKTGISEISMKDMSKVLDNI